MIQDTSILNLKFYILGQTLDEIMFYYKETNGVVLELVTNLKYSEAYICLYSSPYKQGFKTHPPLFSVLYFVLLSVLNSVNQNCCLENVVIKMSTWWNPLPPPTTYSRQQQNPLFMYIISKKNMFICLLTSVISL